MIVPVGDKMFDYETRLENLEKAIEEIRSKKRRRVASVDSPGVIKAGEQSLELTLARQEPNDNVSYMPS